METIHFYSFVRWSTHELNLLGYPRHLTRYSILHARLLVFNIRSTTNSASSGFTTKLIRVRRSRTYIENEEAGGQDQVSRQGDVVLDGVAVPPKRGTAPVFGSCLLWPNGWMGEDATWYGSRPRPRPHCVRLHAKGHSSPPLFGPYLLWPWSPI